MAPRLMGRPTLARELLLEGRGDALTEASLIALMLGEADERIGQELLERHPLPHGLWRLRAEDLCVHEGVGPARAAVVLASLEMSRRAAAWTSRERPVVSTPEDVVHLCEPQLRGADREHFWCLVLNTKNQLLKTVEVSIGSLNASIVHPRELFKEAVRLSAASVVVVHNHPSGDPTPSSADVALTRRLMKAGDVLGIEVLDHVVISEGGDHTSLRDMGLM
jgi:DNA repair protein RadC